MSVIDRRTRLRFRRSVRKSKRHVEDISIQAEEQLERHFIRRLHRLMDVRRFVAGWVVLFVLLMGITVVQLRALSPHYQKTAPAPGGTFTEGMIGTFTNANPLFAVGGLDNAVSQLVFSSLLGYDQQGKLTGDLAKSWKVDENGKVYTVVLRDDAQWHDGTPVTVEDVLFTYRTIQNPDAQSPLFASWRDVKVSSPKSNTLTFTLPNVLASFPHSLTNGIVPKHRLESVTPDQLRSDRFNTVSPLGSGPFIWDAVEVKGQTPEERQEQIALARNDSYYNGAPKLQRFVIKSYRNEETMVKQFEAKQLTAMSGLTSLADTTQEDAAVIERSVPLTGAVMVFFKTTEGVLADREVRRALVQAADTTAIAESLPYTTRPLKSPLLPEQRGYDPAITQLPFNLKKARQTLDAAGWKAGKDGVRTKDGKKLRFTLKAPATSEYTTVTQDLRAMWQELGVEAEVDQPSDIELQSLLALHQYEALAYSISIGQDPDVFAFWHSSQADARSENRLNLSEYQSTQADQALEGARTRVDPKLRAVKYKPFLEAWREDAPALVLYQPRYLYVTRGALYNMDNTVVHSATDRYANVHNWMIRNEKVYKN